MATGRVPTTANSPLTAKGDLFTYSTTQARLAVGNNGDTLLADSSTTTGLRYNPPVGSLANPVINGGADIWQRGTSISLAASTSIANSYIFDRFQMPTSANQACTVSRQTVSDSTNLPNIQYAARIQRNSGQTGTSNLNPSTSVESANSIPFAGKAVTLSFYARAGANYSATSNALPVILVSGIGTDQSVQSGLTSQTTVASGTVTLTTSWQRFVITGTVGSTATQLAMFWTFTPTGTAGANDWFEITGVQIDVGTYTASSAPAFRRSGGTLQGELAAAQRYYWRATANGAFSYFGWAIATGGSGAACIISAPVTFRVAPTSIDYSNISLYNGTTNYPVTSLTIDWPANNQIGLAAGTGSTLTSSSMFRVLANNNSAAYIGVSAEL